MTSDLAAVVMAGGLGTRMRSAVPKHLHPLLGRRMVDWVINAAREVTERVIVVTSPDARDHFDGVEVAIQREPRGTGDAVAAARAALDGFDGHVLVLSGDAPLLSGELLRSLLQHHVEEAADVTLLTFEPHFPLPYGRVIRDGDGGVVGIVEEKDASEEELEISELNSSIYVFRAPALWPALERLDTNNAQGELYLTDSVRHVIAGGGKAAAFESPDIWSAIGVNTREDFASAAQELRERINTSHMVAGVTIIDPYATWIDVDVELEPDCVIHPFTVLRGRTKVAAGAEVGPHVVAVDAVIGRDARVGPFCYLRPGTVLGAAAKAGTFVELKNAQIGDRAKVPHMSYLGDAEVGEDTNVAAGNITANFPHREGEPKGKTTIGRNVRTGIHNGFEAPVEIGDNAWIAGGSYITKDVPPDALAIARQRQENKEGYVRRKRDD